MDEQKRIILVTLDHEAEGPAPLTQVVRVRAQIEVNGTREVIAGELQTVRRTLYDLGFTKRAISSAVRACA